MKKIIVILLLCAGFHYASAQEVYNSSGKPGYHKKTKKDKGYDPSKLVIGGGIMLDYSELYATYGISPIVGYHFTKNLVAGVGLGYIYNQSADPNFFNPPPIYYDKENIVYPNAWVKYFIWRGLYVCGSYEYDFIGLSVPALDINTNNIITERESVNASCLLLGLGVKLHIAGRVSAFVELNRDILQQEYSPYDGEPLIYRAGVTVGL